MFINIYVYLQNLKNFYVSISFVLKIRPIKYNHIKNINSKKIIINMNSSFACISILVKSNIPKNCLINYLNEVSSKSLRSYLRQANIYDGTSNEIKSDLIEMIISGCVNGNLKIKQIDDISNRQVSMIMKEKDISIKSLPTYGNIGLQKKDLKSYEENDKCSIKLKD